MCLKNNEGAVQWDCIGGAVVNLVKGDNNAFTCPDYANVRETKNVATSLSNLGDFQVLCRYT